MSPKKEHIARLAAKWEKQTITPAEELELNAWYQEHQDEQIHLPANFVRSETSHEQRIWNAIQEEIAVKPAVVPLLKQHWLGKIAAAAALIMVIAAGMLFYTHNKVSSDVVAAKNEVAPGKVGATLILANGKRIKLSDATNGELAKEAGVVITKSENGELIYEIKDNSGEPDKVNTLMTANGETYKLRLPDGSFVWLNSASSLTYSSRLVENGKRIVKLQGEGYFEIAKDKSHPFIVATDKQNVEVLGTHFNINSYPDEAMVTTTLIEGSLSVTSGKLKQLIKPGEQAANNGTNIQVNQVNPENILDWKNGDFNLDELDFRVAMRKIARWYDVEIFYDASVPQNIKSGGWISRRRNLSAVLRHIESSGQVHFKLAGRKVYVAK